MKILATILTATLMFVGSVTMTSTKKQKITAKVSNISSDNGKVSFALYNKVTFMKKPLQSKNGKIENGVATVVFEDVEPGEYAIVCFHDKNDNDKMDFSESGMPQEDYGMTNNIMSFGPPSYTNGKFDLGKEDLTLEIKF
jgi:uncharacterized protein (DUF2141 family)